MATVTQTLPLKPLFMQAVGADTPIQYSADNARALPAGLWRIPGPLQRGSFEVAPRQAGVNWSVDVYGGFYVVGGTASADPRWLVRATANINVPLTGFNTAPTATRTHKVWIAVHDENYAGTDLYEARIVITEDVGSGAPVPPNNPAYYHQLGTVSISPAQANISASNIVQTWVYADYSTWAACTLNAAIVSADVESGTSGSLRAKSMFNKVHLKGAVKRSNGSNFVPDNNYTIGNVPYWYAPLSTRYGTITGQATANSPTIHARVQVTSAGSIVVNFPAVVGTQSWTPLWISFDGFCYEMDD